MLASKQPASLDYSEFKKMLNLHHKCEEIHQTHVFMNTITVSKTNGINISSICYDRKAKTETYHCFLTGHSELTML